MRKEHQSLILRVVQLRADLGRAELYRAMHAMDEVQQTIGWEVAARQDPAQARAEARYRRRRK